MHTSLSECHRPISILFLVTGLIADGAERMLYRLISRMDRKRFVVTVVNMADVGSLGEQIRALGVPLRSLGMRPGVPNPMSILRLSRWLRQNPPDVIQTWMYHADLLGGLAAKLAGGIPVAWGIRNSNLDDQGSRRLTIYTMRACAQMSKWLPTRIVCCSEASQRVHTALGYATHKTIVIPNGFDLHAFKTDWAARESARAELHILPDAPLIGLVGRFHPQKDHRNFVRAAALLHRSRPDVHFLMCGDEVTWENGQLRGWIEEAGIGKQCRLLGRRDDMSRLTAGFDIGFLPHLLEKAFPM